MLFRSLTAAAIGSRIGLLEGKRVVTGPELEAMSDEELRACVEDIRIYARVNPEHKLRIVDALKSRGHVVAMTGDGVNDALALKAADIGVAMGSGAPATRAVAKLVLLDGRFDRMPGVVAEGRRVIANVERVANLFLTKSTYAALIAVAVVLGVALFIWWRIGRPGWRRAG